MFTKSAPLTARRGDRGFLIGLVAFVFGVIVGAAVLGPTVAGRNDTPKASPGDADITGSILTAPGFGSRAYSAQVLRVFDGDTFDATLEVKPGIEITTRVRLRGVDTPEMKARCPEERVKAEAARAKLKTILAEGSVEIRDIGPDKFAGRIDAAASTRFTPDVSAAIVKAGLGRSYDGGRREGWCS